MTTEQPYQSSFAAPGLNPQEGVDTSHVFDQFILYYNQAPPLMAPSKAVIITSEHHDHGSVTSHDPSIMKDPNALQDYFLTYLGSPKVFVEVHGTHTETHGYGKDRHTRTVTDFSIQLELSHYVNPQWQSIAAIPTNGTPRKTVRQTLEEFTSAKGIMKEIHLEKNVVWEWEELESRIVQGVRDAGYEHKVLVIFKKSGNRVNAYSSSASTAEHDTALRVLCVITCLWIIFYPIYSLTASKTSNILIAQFIMVHSTQEFYARNSPRILEAVAKRTRISDE